MDLETVVDKVSSTGTETFTERVEDGEFKNTDKFEVLVDVSGDSSIGQTVEQAWEGESSGPVEVRIIEKEWTDGGKLKNSKSIQSKTFAPADAKGFQPSDLDQIRKWLRDGYIPRIQ